MSETLEQLTHRLTRESSVGYLREQPSLEVSMASPFFKMTCKLVRLALEHERERCKKLAQDWLDDPCPSKTISEYMDVEVCNGAQ